MGWPPLPAAPTLAASIAAAVVRCGRLAVQPPLCSCAWQGIQRLLAVVTVGSATQRALPYCRRLRPSRERERTGIGNLP
jgi:hypothetical protein